MSSIAFAHYNLRANRELLDTLRSFYCEVVGLRLGARPPFSNHGYWLYAGDHDVLHLSETSAGELRQTGTKSTFDHAAFACSGRSEAESRLAQHGVKYRVAQVPGNGPVQLFFDNPAGNGVELSFAADDR